MATDSSLATGAPVVGALEVLEVLEVLAVELEVLLVVVPVVDPLVLVRSSTFANGPPTYIDHYSSSSPSFPQRWW